MKKTLFSVLLVASALLSAQEGIFAVTGKTSSEINFKDIRSLSGHNSVYLKAESKPEVFSEILNLKVSEDQNSVHHATAKAMATLAVTRDGTLLYMPLLSGNIYELNPQSKVVTLIESPLPKTVSCDLTSHFTRMATDGNGDVFAMSNSGSQLMVIADKNGKHSVRDLGKITDLASNDENLLGKMETGFGGDMVFDNQNNLVVFSASGNVFKVILTTMKAEFVGKIKGLPEGFSVNGTAANAKGEVILGSAKGGQMWKVSIENLLAAPLANASSDPIYDLASPYFISEKALNQNASTIEVYPTRITENLVNVRLNNSAALAKEMQIFDASGRLVESHNIQSKEANTTLTFHLKNLITGNYIIKLVDTKGKILITKKVIVSE